MTNPVKLYVGLVLAFGALYLGGAIHDWRCTDSAKFGILLALALLAACFKARLPGMHGTISFSFVMLLIGMAQLGFSETVAMGAAVAVVQSVWRARRRPRLVQVAFNLAVLAASAGAAYQALHALHARIVGTNGLFLEMTVGAGVYFLLNTLMVSGILALLQNQPVMEVWKNCHMWSFPYYLVGAAVGSLICMSARSVGWQSSLLVLPVMVLVYLCYRGLLERLAPATAASAGVA